MPHMGRPLKYANKQIKKGEDNKGEKKTMLPLCTQEWETLRCGESGRAGGQRTFIIIDKMNCHNFINSGATFFITKPQYHPYEQHQLLRKGKTLRTVASHPSETPTFCNVLYVVSLEDSV